MSGYIDIIESCDLSQYMDDYENWKAAGCYDSFETTRNAWVLMGRKTSLKYVINDCYCDAMQSGVKGQR